MRLLVSVVGAVAVLSLFAQNEEDALRYSLTVPGGTARSWALGSAFGAVGADPASASINPAGFGLYNASEVSLTPGFEVNDARSTHYGTSASDNDQRFFFNNMSLMLFYPNDAGKDWRGGCFGISFDRLASFHWNERAVGEHVNSSELTRFVNEANGHAYGDLETLFPFTSFLAWYTYAIDTLPGSTDQYVAAIPQGSDVKQTHTIDASGRMNGSSFFYANNYKDKLYIGAALGLNGVRYERHTAHTEVALDTATALKSFQYKEDLLTTGNGIDLKIGIIGRATDRLRLGASFHSPMWLSLSDAYSYHITTAFRVGEGQVKDSPDGTFSYRVTTPWSVVASAAYVAGKHGLVSVDYTYTDYRQARLRASQDLVDEYDFSIENGLIKSNFTGTHGLRVGTEWRSGNWYFRGGGAFTPDPYAGTDARHGTAHKQYSGGIGFRTTHVSVDLAFIYGMRDTNYFQYNASLVKPTSEKLTDARTLITVGFRP